jgi:hypothetical protein
LITEARTSGDDAFDRRRRRYLLMMTLRGVCIISAALTVGISGWLAAGFVAAALVLPWAAVLVANDRPPKETVRFRRFLPGQGQPGPKELTDGRPVDGPAPHAQHADARQSESSRPRRDNPTVIDI